MKKTLLLIALVAISICSRAQISTVYTYQFQHLLDSLCARYKIKGLSAAIYIPNEGTWNGASGVSHDNVPITTDMYFPIGSNTKTFTSAIILKLQEQGKLTINDTIGKWIQNPNVSGQITIKQLLHHQSGLYDYSNNPGFSTAFNADFSKIWAPEDMLQFLKAPVAAPGGQWDYCNTNYLLLGLIIKQVTGQPLQQTYRDMIFNPQSLSNTYYCPQEPIPANVPHGWYWGGGHFGDMQIEADYTLEAALSSSCSAGAIMSTAEDNVMFWHKMMTGAIINSSSLTQFKETVDIGGGDGYGLGVFNYHNINGRTVYQHGGTHYGYINENLWDEETGVCITVLSNQDSLKNPFLFTKVVMALHRITTKMPPTAVRDIQKQSKPILVYPNPASNFIKTDAGTINDASYSITDMSGRRVQTGTLTQGPNTIDIANHTSGMYLINIYNKEGMLSTQRIQVIQ
ncbi:MAG: T9SS type A sorting domain-containing protein [Sphingobacteriales bacterium]|nr:MAG: T9SS type A sorting domain-containing protein [Sphingobacteriales bacterium]